MNNMDEKFDVIIDNGKTIDVSNGQGWQCPKCGSIVSPNVLVCPICGGKRTNENLNPGEMLICG